jgi:hypothetical protein
MPMLMLICPSCVSPCVCLEYHQKAQRFVPFGDTPFRDHLPCGADCLPVYRLGGLRGGVSGLSARLTPYAQATFWSISLDAHDERWLTLYQMTRWTVAIHSEPFGRPVGYGEPLPVARAAYPLQLLTRVANFGVLVRWIASRPY